MLTLAVARQIFSCDPESGEVRWAVTRVASVQAGTLAGNATKRYRWIKFEGRYYAAHKIVWLFATGLWPDHQIDHINGDTFDNRLSNLRATTIAENSRNRRIRRDNKAGLKGIQLRPSGLWRARIWLNGKSVSLGHFKTADEAHAAYVAAARANFGDFASAG